MSYNIYSFQVVVLLPKVIEIFFVKKQNKSFVLSQF